MRTEKFIELIQKHVEGFDCTKLKSFYEHLGFTDVYIDSDEYLDYYTDEKYLKGHILGNEEDIEDKLIANKVLIVDNQEDEDIDNIKRWLKTLKRIDDLPLEDGCKSRVLKMIDDAIKNIDAKSYLGVMIFVGSILEGILLGLLSNVKNPKTSSLRNRFLNSQDAKKVYYSPIFRDLVQFANQDEPKFYSFETKDVVEQFKKNNSNSTSDKTEQDFGKWDLNDYLKVVKREGFLETKTIDSSVIIQQARNYVHPNEQVKHIKKFDFTIQNTIKSVLCLKEVVEKLKQYFED